MLTYLTQRLLYVLPVVILVSFVTFVLFFMVVPPEIMARRHLSAKAPTQEDLQNWLQQHGYDKPLCVNLQKDSHGKRHPLDTQFVRHMRSVVTFDLGKSDQTGEAISSILKRRMGPSLMLTVPAFILALFIDLSLSLLVAYYRGTYADRWALLGCVLLMSVPFLVYIIVGQWLISLQLRLFPLSGWEGGFHAAKFLYLPIVLSVVSGIGGSVRFYRTLMLEETSRDYVRTARAKGMGETRILFRDVLKNAMIPILTSAVMAIPFLFLGSLLLENFFGIPGLGSLTIDAINASDFAVLRAMVFVGALLYVLGLLLTDVSYTLVDPRVRFEGTPLNRMVLPVAVSTAAVFGFGALARGAVQFGERAQSLGQSIQRPWIAQNVFVCVLTVAAGVAVWSAMRRPHWQEAWRRVKQVQLAVVALLVVCLYGALGLSDSLSWKDSRGDLRPLSLLDRAFHPARERTYSAPFATHEIGERDPQRLQHGRHYLGTDSTGEDVLYQSVKGVRTALIIGLFTTLLVIPLAIVMGLCAGYYRGWVDDTIQFLYTMLNSIPDILLLVALMMILGRGLPQVCFALAITSWVGLCRLLRGETLKLRELDYVQAGRALGLSDLRILWQHILPNVMHVVVIAFVLRFSGLVMSEVILSYLGIGVTPGTASWGTMIDGARLELARDPTIWWNLTGAFTFMFVLVLAFNFFGDTLRDALDPRLRER